MDKTEVPPSGDKHDYMSLAPYYWPTQPQTADNPWGCPYVDKDGQVSPISKSIPDKPEWIQAYNAIYQLSLAWYYTGDISYAQRAELDIRTWFLDAATKMNPNLNFAQGIPCQVDGRGIGIIDFGYSFTEVLDAVDLLNDGAPGWQSGDASRHEVLGGPVPDLVAHQQQRRVRSRREEQPRQLLRHAQRRDRVVRRSEVAGQEHRHSRPRPSASPCRSRPTANSRSN